METIYTSSQNEEITIAFFNADLKEVGRETGKEIIIPKNKDIKYISHIHKGY